MAREEDGGEKRLVAYLVAREGVELSTAELRSQLTAALPEYMVPSAFVSLEKLPLTPNGKLDRRALPAPDRSSVVTRTYEVPVGEVEEGIAQIWKELLGLEKVGRHDHFFELGGQSLMAVTLIERLRQQGMTADVRTIFTNPTVSALAAALAEGECITKVFVVPPNRIPSEFGQPLHQAIIEEFRL